jgi:hypothetical protein
VREAVSSFLAERIPVLSLNSDPLTQSEPLEDTVAGNQSVTAFCYIPHKMFEPIFPLSNSSVVGPAFYSQ